LLKRLERGLPVPTRGAQDAPVRQQTLRNTLDWSNDLLDHRERALFRRLSVFAGGCSLEAAEAVCTASDLSGNDLIDGLQSLVNHSLLLRLREFEQESRFGMLETIREYALERLAAAAEVNPIRERHLSWCTAYAEAAESELRGPNQQQVLTDLEVEHDNLRLALSWSLERPQPEVDAIETVLRLCGALARFWSVRGYMSEGKGWLERVMEKADRLGEVSTPSFLAARAKALLGLGGLCGACGDFSLELEHVQASLLLYRQLGDHRGMAAALQTLAHLADYQGQPERSRALFEESISQARAGGDDNQVAEGLSWLARSLSRSGDIDAARAALNDSARLLLQTGDLARRAGTLFIRGTIEAGQENLSVAPGLLEASRDLYRQAGDRIGETRAIAWLGYASLAAGDPAAARRYLLESVDRGRHDGINELPSWLCQLARAERADGRSPEAWQYARESLALYQRMGYPAAAVRTLEVASGLLAETGERSDSELAARLFAAARTHRDHLHVRLSRSDRAEIERDINLVRRQLPNLALDLASEQGKTMSFQEAFSRALSEFNTRSTIQRATLQPPGRSRTS
jgi:predicted ATPase